MWLIDAQAEAAADAGVTPGSSPGAWDALYQAWRGPEVLAMQQMIATAQALPALTTYALNDTMPSVVLAQMLYQDPTRAQQLEDMNDVPHPLFMPASGIALAT